MDADRFIRQDVAHKANHRRDAMALERTCRMKPHGLADRFVRQRDLASFEIAIDHGAGMLGLVPKPAPGLDPLRCQRGFFNDPRSFTWVRKPGRTFLMPAKVAKTKTSSDVVPALAKIIIRERRDD